MKLVVALEIERVGEPFPRRGGKQTETLYERGQGSESPRGLAVLLQRHKPDGAGVGGIVARLASRCGSLMEGQARAVGIITRIGRRRRKMLVQQNAGEQAHQGGLVRDVFEAELVGHPAVPGNIVEPAPHADREQRREFRQQQMTFLQPAEQAVGHLPVINASRPKTTLHRRPDPVAQLFPGNLVNHGTG